MSRCELHHCDPPLYLLAAASVWPAGPSCCRRLRACSLLPLQLPLTCPPGCRSARTTNLSCLPPLPPCQELFHEYWRALRLPGTPVKTFRLRLFLFPAAEDPYTPEDLAYFSASRSSRWVLHRRCVLLLRAAAHPVVE